MINSMNGLENTSVTRHSTVAAGRLNELQEMLNDQKHSSMAEESCDEWGYLGTISAYSHRSTLSISLDQSGRVVLDRLPRVSRRYTQLQLKH